MARSLRETLAQLPPILTDALCPDIRAAIRRRPAHKVVVLDDDPTGTQTVHDVPVLTTWDAAALEAEFAADGAGFYILTNSRSRTAASARDLTLEIAHQLHTAAAGRSFTVISRSDSTLRGHFPIETDVLNEVLGPFDATLLVPYFEAGGRYTIDDVHYVANGDELIPAAETAFARDASFGYVNSNLCEWVAEKTGGRVRPADVRSISISELRCAPADAGQRLGARLGALPRGCYCVVNAGHPLDVERFAAGALLAEQAGARLLYRTAAQFVAARLGIEPRSLLTADELDRHAPAAGGGLVVVGSYVPQSSQQLSRLMELREIAGVEVPVSQLLNSAARDLVVRAISAEIDRHLQAGRDTVVFTSREVILGRDTDESLRINAAVSGGLIDIVRAVQATPRFLVAKGGITSSDVATQALEVRRALVRGQILPGVPVWRLGPESRYPGLHYIVFPGNVGGPDALADVVRILSRNR